MPEPPYRALRIFLRVFSLLAALGGLLMIFAEKPLIVRIFLRPPEGEMSTLLLSLLKKTGGMALMLGVLLWLASRNPVRNVAVVDALIAGLCILALTPLLSLWMTDIGYAGYTLPSCGGGLFAVADSKQLIAALSRNLLDELWFRLRVALSCTECPEMYRKY